jgi:tetratricopeptide (TPR) repeat protein
MSASRWVAALAFCAALGCATTSKDAAKDVQVAGPAPAEEGKPGAAGAPAQPQINTRAKLKFEDANKAFEAQKKSGKYDYPALERMYQAALDADPNLAEAEYDLGVIAEREGNKDLATAHYKSALNRKKTLKEAAENLAVLAQNSGDTAGATKVYTQIMETYPDDASSRARLAEIYRQQGDTDKALDLAKQALARDPKSLVAYKVMMECSFEKKQLAMAKLIALRAIKLDESDPELYFDMGLILVKENEPEKALLQFKKSLEVRPDYLPAHVVLAKISMDKENYLEAEEHLRKMIQADPKNAALHLDLGVAYKGQGQMDKALQEYDAAEKLDPNLPAIYLNRGIILHRFKNSPGPAIELYKKYIAMNGAQIQDHPVNGLLTEATQLIEADKQAKEQEELQKKQELEKKQNDDKAKQDTDKQKADAAKGGVAADAAAADSADDKSSAGAGASTDKPAAKSPSVSDKAATRSASGGRASAGAKAADTTSPAAAPAKPAPAKKSDEPADEPKDSL